MSEYTTVARPYARAAFTYAVEHNTIEQWQQMLSFVSQVAAHEDINRFLKSTTHVGTTVEVFLGVCAGHIDEKGQNFIKIMAENHRLPALPEVSRLFEALKDDYEKEIVVDVTSATDLSSSEADKIKAALEQRLVRKVKLNCSVDPSTMGGLLIQAGDMVIDGTVRSKLSRLATTLQA